ncbi:hypothetical protein QQG74_16130 [Micromonospora sp. FIMYZ51]
MVRLILIVVSSPLRLAGLASSAGSALDLVGSSLGTVGNRNLTGS